MRFRFPLARLALARGGGLAWLALPPLWRAWRPAWLVLPPAWLAWPTAWLAVEQVRLVLWLPVLMGAGVLTYFALRQEPPLWAGLALLLPALVGGCLARPGSLTRGALAAL